MATKKKVKSKATDDPSVEVASDRLDICFTIMPFGGWFDDYYDSVFRPAIKAAGLKPRRADDLYRPSTIVNDIWEITQKAKVILADLSGKNPNVFYELGLAHALAKPAILVTESMDDVPFDLRALRVIEYDKNAPNWGEQLSGKIEKSIGEVLESPAQAVLPAFLDVKRNAAPPKVSEIDKDIIQLKQQVARLNRESRTENSVYRSRRLDGPDEAEELLRSYANDGMPERLIARRLIQRGAPKDWVEHRLRSPHEYDDDSAISPNRVKKKAPAKKASKKKIAKKKVAKKRAAKKS